jgi:membrane protease YdiL (CAAX protease family)
VRAVLKIIFNNTLFAPFLLYLLLFFPDFSTITELFLSALPEEIFVPFSVPAELWRIAAFFLPSLAAVLYFCVNENPESLAIKPRHFLMALPGTMALFMIGSLTVFAESFFAESTQMPLLEGPQGFFAVFVMILSCLCVGYLEESFFRIFLTSRLLRAGVKKIPAILITAFLFALCHIWEGMWGTAGAFFSGLFLSFLLEKTRSLHCVALSHAFYNIAVYFFAG